MRDSHSPFLRLRGFLWAFAFAYLVAMGASAVFGTSYATLIPIKAKGSGPLYRIQENGGWGYMNRGGNVVIPPQFEHADDFFDHKAAVLLGGKTGYIDESGTWQIEPKFSSASRFNNGVAIVGFRDAEGLIDATGRFLVDPKFEKIEQFSEGFAAAWSGPNRQPFGRAVIVYGGKWGFIDTSGKIVIPATFDEVKPFYSGVSVYWDDRVLKDGLIDHSGSVVVPARYSQIGSYLDDDPFHDGFARAAVEDGPVEFLRPSGTVAFQCPRASCSDFSEGLSHVSEGVRSGYIDTTGAIVITLDFDDARDFSDGLAAVEEQGLWGYIAKTGRWVIEPRYAQAFQFVDGLALARLGTVGSILTEPVASFAIRCGKVLTDSLSPVRIDADG